MSILSDGLQVKLEQEARMAALEKRVEALERREQLRHSGEGDYERAKVQQEGYAKPAPSPGSLGQTD